MLKKSAPSRVVNATSIGHLACTDMVFDDFNLKRGCWGLSEFYTYARSNAASVLFSKELTRKFASKQ